MSGSIRKRWTLFGVAMGAASTTLALVVGLGVLAGAGAAASNAAPANTNLPTISGTAQEGNQLSGDRGNWNNSPTSYDYRWRRCNSSRNDCSNINGAQDTTYTLVTSDIGHTIRLAVTATNADGKTTATSAATNVVKGAASLPRATSPPTIKGTPQEGQKLTGDKGMWSGNPSDYNYFWSRCDKTGGSCADINGAHATTYMLTSTDVGNTLRFKVQAKNANGSNFASSVPSAVITSATKPPPPPSATGCPAGTGPVQASSVMPPARLLIDGQQANPSVVRRGTQQLLVRYHVSACGGRSVQGALVYGTAVPFNQLTIPPEQTTGTDGWATLDFRMLTGFPVSSKQGLIAIFTRARKSGESVLGGVSTRRLFSVNVNLNG